MAVGALGDGELGEVVQLEGLVVDTDLPAKMMMVVMMTVSEADTKRQANL